ncbi:MAG: hypothetical protein ACR2HG_06050 [Pyrinomonadaceae bacterium]
MEKIQKKISRSWGATIGYLIGALVAGGISVLLFMTIVGGAVTFGIALIPAIISLLLFAMSFGGSGVSVCPNCAAPLDGLSTKSNDGVLCRACHRYFEGKDGLLWQTDENRVADNPIFSSPLPEEFAFPKYCCVCGSPETSRETISYTTQNASSVITAPTIGVRTDTKISVGVPHCSQHKGGAALSGSPDKMLVRFRSYPYLRAFCQLNGTVPA